MLFLMLQTQLLMIQDVGIEVIYMLYIHIINQFSFTPTHTHIHTYNPHTLTHTHTYNPHTLTHTTHTHVQPTHTHKHTPTYMRKHILTDLKTNPLESRHRHLNLLSPTCSVSMSRSSRQVWRCLWFVGMLSPKNL